jgi:hypothetical protein
MNEPKYKTSVVGYRQSYPEPTFGISYDIPMNTLLLSQKDYMPLCVWDFKHNRYEAQDVIDDYGIRLYIPGKDYTIGFKTTEGRTRFIMEKT